MNTVEETVEETEKINLKTMANNPKVTAKEMQVITFMYLRGMECHLNKMKQNKQHSQKPTTT